MTGMVWANNKPCWAGMETFPLLYLTLRPKSELDEAFPQMKVGVWMGEVQTLSL
jgi:hypothetical protein